MAVSAACILHLWRSAAGGIGKKVLWTAIILLPVMGPLFYGSMYAAPSEQDEDMRASETDTDDD
jgi:hypothetical protein